MAAQPQPDSPVRAAKRSRSSDGSPAVSISSERLSNENDSKLPAFLCQSDQELEYKFEEINKRQQERLQTGSQVDSPWFVRITREHRMLNRYTDIWPWESTRVKLRVPEGSVDYINASAITLHASTGDVQRRYIASQGPKQNNVDHFWQMIWQHTKPPVVIVMLTQLIESMREKCHKYFPESADSEALKVQFVDENATPHEGSVKVKSVSTDDDSKTSIREIILSYNGTERTIWHLFFQAWPDFGVPQDGDRSALLNLIRLSREKNEGWSNPRIVHCSAGVGRSGTFIAMEHLIDELDQGRFDSMTSSEEDPIFETVCRLREQRMTMVQSDAQYYFLYESLANAYRQRLQDKGHSTVSPTHVSSQKLKNGEPLPKAVRLSRTRGLVRNLITDIRSRSSSRKRESNSKTPSDEKPPPSPLYQGQTP